MFIIYVKYLIFVAIFVFKGSPVTPVKDINACTESCGFLKLMRTEGKINIQNT